MDGLNDSASQPVMPARLATPKVDGCASGCCQGSLARGIDRPPLQLVGSRRNGFGGTPLAHPDDGLHSFCDSRISLCTSAAGTPQIVRATARTGSCSLMFAMSAVKP